MPSFYTDVMDAFYSCKQLLVTSWDLLPMATRLVIVLAFAMGFLYLATKMEQAGWSVVLMLSSFAMLAYLLTLGYALIR